MPTVLLSCGGGGGFGPDGGVDAKPPGGKFSLAWSLTDANGTAISCAQVGATVISVGLRNRDEQGGQTEVFTCASATGVSGALAPGTYDLTFALNGLSGPLGTAAARFGLVIASNQTTELEPIAFAVDAVGNLALKLDANQPTGNCAADGANITGTRITLTRNNVCEPVTFAISAGATQPASTYTVNCAAPVVGPCIESDQTLTVSGVPSGNYKIVVRGQSGATDCWNNDDTIVVPPLGRTLDATLNLLEQPGC